MSLSFSLALLLSAFSGWSALVYEMLWARVYYFQSGGRSVAFATMLSAYLLGLALGALWSRRFQQKETTAPELRLRMSRLVLVSNVAAFLVAPAVSWLVVITHWSASLALVTLAAALLGILLPLLCQAAIPAGPKSGAQLSLIYVANIVGSGLGTLIAGLMLFQWLTLGQIAATLLLMALIASFLLIGAAVRWNDWILRGGSALLIISSPWLHRGLYERLQWHQDYRNHAPFSQIVETRHGVITVDNQKVVYGGGVYDGLIDVRPHNWLLRPYFVSAIHPAPKNILVIGVSGGAWTQILVNHPQVEQVTAVEINDGYLKVIGAYPEVSSLLSNPKLKIVIDDGRRWLRRNPDRKFDVVVMNTTFNWREFASALLGREFLELAKSHLNPGGIVMWNCTGSGRAIATGLSEFPHTIMLMNNCIASMSPLAVDEVRWKAILTRYQIDGRPVFDLSSPAGRRELDAVVGYLHTPAARETFWERPAMEEIWGANRIITDDNMGEEYSFAVRHNLFLKYIFQLPGLRK